MTNEGKGDTEKWIKEKGAQYAYGYDRGGKLKAKCGITGIPHAYLLDASGKITWEGHPGELTENTIKDSLAGALKRPIWELPKEFAKVKAAIVKNDLPTAVKEAQAVAGDTGAPPESKAVLDEVMGMVTGSLNAAETSAKTGDYLKAQRSYTKLVKSLSGLPEAATAKQALDDLNKNPQALAGIKAQLELDKVLEMPDKKASDRTAKQEALNAFKKKYPGTYAYSDADRALAALAKAAPKK